MYSKILNEMFEIKPDGIEFDDTFYSNKEVDILKKSKADITQKQNIHLAKKIFSGEIMEYKNG